MADPIFEVDDVYYSYPGGVPALCGVSLSVEPSERIALLGANASGKSTLLHLLDGLIFPSRGQVRALGVALTERAVESPPFSVQFRRAVGLLFQNSDAQLFSATVEEELAFGPLQLRLPPEQVTQRVDDTLALLELEHLRDRSPQTLSGGEKKQVALAAILTCAPHVILLDEPSAGLDPRACQWLVEFCEALHGSGVTLLIASHDLDFVAETTDRALVLSEDHRLVFDGPAAAALDDPDLLYAANLVRKRRYSPVGR